MLLIAKKIYIVCHDAKDKDQYVVHLQLIGPYGGTEIQKDFITNLSLKQIRQHMRELHLYCEERIMGEDPLIVEKWI